MEDLFLDGFSVYFYLNVKRDLRFCYYSNPEHHTNEIVVQYLLPPPNVRYSIDTWSICLKVVPFGETHAYLWTSFHANQVVLMNISRDTASSVLCRWLLYDATAL